MLFCISHHQLVQHGITSPESFTHIKRYHAAIIMMLSIFRYMHVYERETERASNAGFTGHETIALCPKHEVTLTYR
jgi:hypothetical protein